MTYKHFILLLFGSLCFMQCKTETETNNKSEEKESYKDIIRNPITANGTIDEDQVAEISFTEKSFSFDTIPEGKSIEHEFEFSNTGNVSLVISKVQSTCGCTVPSWPNEAIAPGESSKIKVIFDSDGKPKKQVKPITVIANTIPNKTTLIIEGFVIPKEGED